VIRALEASAYIELHFIDQREAVQICFIEAFMREEARVCPSRTAGDNPSTVVL
jgi:hypothetical protein